MGMEGRSGRAERWTRSWAARVRWGARAVMAAREAAGAGERGEGGREGGGDGGGGRGGGVSGVGQWALVGETAAAPALGDGAGGEIELDVGPVAEGAQEAAVLGG